MSTPLLTAAAGACPGRHRPPRSRRHRARGRAVRAAGAQGVAAASRARLWLGHADARRRGIERFHPDFRLPNLAGYTPIHILTVVTFVFIGRGLWLIARRRIAQHRLTMWAVYLGSCVTAGAFALMPGRFLGDLLWRQTLGWI